MQSFSYVKGLPSYDASNVFYVRIDPSICVSDELLKSLYYLLWFPGYFGFNWNGLYDCLIDLSWIKYHKIIIVHELLPNLPEKDLKIYVQVLNDAANDWLEDEKHELEVVFFESDRVVVESFLND